MCSQANLVPHCSGSDKHTCLMARQVCYFGFQVDGSGITTVDIVGEGCSGEHGLKHFQSGNWRVRE